MSKHVITKGKVYRYVYHYANLYRINLKINNKDIVKTVPDTYTKTQLRIVIKDLMRDNGLNEAQITKSMVGWGKKDGSRTRHVKFPTKVNKSGYLGVSHKIWLSSGQFICQYKGEIHDKFTYPIRQFSEDVFWIKEKEMLDAYEQACNASDMKRYGEILVREHSKPKNNPLTEMKDYCHKKNLACSVSQVIIANTITSLIKTINASSKRTEYFTSVNVSGHKLVHPYCDSKSIGYKITSTSNPLKDEIFAVPLQKISHQRYIANSTELEIKFSEASAYADEKFGFRIKHKSEYIKLLKDINWSERLLKTIPSETKPKVHFFTNNDAGNLKNIIQALLLKDLPLIKPHLSSNEIGYTFEINGEKHFETIQLKKIYKNHYWANQSKILKLYINVHKKAEKLSGLIPRTKIQHKAKRTDDEWLSKFKADFETENKYQIIHLSDTIGELKQKLIKQLKNEEREALLLKEKQDLLDRALAAKGELIKQANNEETGHKLVKAKVVFGHAVYFSKQHNLKQEIKLIPVKNSGYTISREKLIEAFVKICRKVDHSRNIKDISDDTYKSLYRDINWLERAKVKNKRFKSIIITD